MKKFILIFISILTLCAVSVFARDVTLQWDENTEENLAGYKMYYDTDSGPPYEGQGSTDGNSPIDIPLSKDENQEVGVFEFTVHGLPDDVAIYFAVTAYNSDNPPLESGYSNEVNVEGPPPPPDTTPPVISDILIASKTYDSAIITWITDEPSNSLIQYGIASEQWGDYPLNQSDNALITNHSILLNDLENETTYYFRVGSIDASDNGPTISDEMNFTTEPAPPPDEPPSIPTGFRIILMEPVNFSYNVIGLPISLFTNNTQEDATATINIQGKPAMALSAELKITVFDPDYSDEGRLYINDLGPVSLFGPTADENADNNITREVSFIVPAAYFQNGENVLHFWHDRTQGYRIQQITLNFM